MDRVNRKEFGMDIFGKALAWTMAIGFALMGIYVGLLILRIAIEVAGFLLGSSLGTLVLVFLLYFWWKAIKDKLD